MKNNVTLCVVALLLGVSFIPKVSAQDGNLVPSIKLLQSTRFDVERELGKPYSNGYYVTYELKTGIAYFDYYPFDRCKSDGKSSPDLNVLEWTVTAISFRPDEPPELTPRSLDQRRFRQAHESPGVPDLVSYIDDQEGLAYVFTSDDILIEIRYFVGTKYNSLKCPK
ncbi:MAG: hypothetical protein ABIP75_17030 [Pyrinomonadaceae bacterium]